MHAQPTVSMHAHSEVQIKSAAKQFQVANDIASDNCSCGSLVRHIMHDSFIRMRLLVLKA